MIERKSSPEQSGQHAGGTAGGKLAFSMPVQVTRDGAQLASEHSMQAEPVGLEKQLAPEHLSAEPLVHIQE